MTLFNYDFSQKLQSYLNPNNVSKWNDIGGVMVSVFASTVVDRLFKPRSGQTKDYEIGICCFSAKHERVKDRLAQNQDNVYEWGDMSTCWLLFQWASTIKIQLSVVV
jgi:hypothetical protein